MSAFGAFKVSDRLQYSDRTCPNDGAMDDKQFANIRRTQLTQ